MTSPAFAGYCETTDLLVGNIPMPDYLNPEKFVLDAANEIDSVIGFIYQTPVDITETSPVARPARLLLHRLNVFIATGRLLMAADANGEDTQVHAYALKLLQDASATLKMIAEGKINLEGAVKVEGAETTSPLGPLIANGDPESYVDAFYDRIVNPAYAMSPTYFKATSGAENPGLVSQ